MVTDLCGLSSGCLLVVFHVCTSSPHLTRVEGAASLVHHSDADSRVFTEPIDGEVTTARLAALHF